MFSHRSCILQCFLVLFFCIPVWEVTIQSNSANLQLTNRIAGLLTATMYALNVHVHVYVPEPQF